AVEPAVAHANPADTKPAPVAAPIVPAPAADNGSTHPVVSGDSTTQDQSGTSGEVSRPAPNPANNNGQDGVERIDGIEKPEPVDHAGGISNQPDQPGDKPSSGSDHAGGRADG